MPCVKMKYVIMDRYIFQKLNLLFQKVLCWLRLTMVNNENKNISKPDSWIALFLLIYFYIRFLLKCYFFQKYNSRFKNQFCCYRSILPLSDYDMIFFLYFFSYSFRISYYICSLCKSILIQRMFEVLLFRLHLFRNNFGVCSEEVSF